MYNGVLVSLLVTQSCPTHCDPRDCSPPGVLVSGIRQSESVIHISTFFLFPDSFPMKVITDF